MVQFPQGFNRTPSEARDQGYRFYRGGGRDYNGNYQPRRPPTIAQSTTEILRQVRNIPGASDCVIESDLRYKNDGTPYSNQRTPEDPGVVVRFKRNGRPFAVPCDRFTTIEGNLRAVALMLEASRQMERYGFEIFEDDFRGYAALPEHAISVAQSANRDPPLNPWVELGLEPGTPFADVKARWRELVKTTHPDVNNGDDRQYRRVMRAYDMLKPQEATA